MANSSYMKEPNYQHIFSNLLMLCQMGVLVFISWQLTQPLNCALTPKQGYGYVRVK